MRSPASSDLAFEKGEASFSDSSPAPNEAQSAFEGVSSFVDELEQLKRQNAALDGELRAARDQFQAILDAVPGGVSWLDRDLKYLGINSNLAQTFGLAPAEFIGRRIGFLGASPAFENFARDFFDGELDNDAHELEMEVGSGHRFYFMMARKYRDGQSALFVGIDITDRKEAEDKLRRDAFYDQLTGLPNRALLLERLERALEFSRRRDNYLFAVLFLDFDGFKVVNDSLGHTVGDKLLQNVARRLEGMSRASDTVSRLGGDEYVLILDGIDDLSGATHIAERIHRMMGMPFVIDGQEIFLTVSIGITVNTSNYSDTEEILRDADIAMYRAKSGGRNRYEVFDRAMHDATLQRLQMETDLHRSLENRDFLLHFQPIIDLQNGELTAFEALVRWQRPRAGFTQPGDFIALAEETGLIVHLDRWVFRHACEQMRLWLDEFGPQRCPKFISVNLSSRHFAYPDLVESVSNILDETALPPQFVRLEVTESAIMENIESVAISLRGLERLGVGVGLDDFGTGYSSLNYLHRLPLQTLKIDRSFAPELSAGGQSDKVVRAIVTLAHSLEMKVVAEGIETGEQLAQLVAIGCDYVQGHLFSRALDLPGATEILRQGSPERFRELLGL